MILSSLNLQLFADGGGDGGEGTGVGASVSAMQESTGVKNTKSASDLSEVRYGVQAQDEGETDGVEENVADSSEQKQTRASFDELIKGDYKADFDKRVQEIVQARLKNSKQDSEKLASLSPMMELLAKRYGVSDATDINALSKAIQEDDSFYEAEAIEKGLTVEQLKDIKRMERENAELKREMDEQRKRRTADETYSRWMSQAADTQKMYSGFNLNEEVKNPKFVSLLQSGIDVKTAFEVIHKDEIIPQAMQMTAKAVESKIANSIRSGKRPSENGAGAQAAPVIKNSVSQFTKADMKEIERRVARGERIVL